MAFCNSAAQADGGVRLTLQEHLLEAFEAYVGQKESLNAIRERFPSLAGKVLLAQMEWEKYFDAAEENLEKRLEGIFQSRWPDFKRSTVSTAKKMLGDRMASATVAEAQAYLDDIPKRAKGELDPVMRDMLLASHPEYIQRPEVEFSRGYTATYSTQGHPKSNGVKMVLKLPMSWARQEGDRPHIVQKWKSDAGHGKDEIMIIISDLAEMEPDAKIRELYSKEIMTEAGIRELLDGVGELVRFKAGTIEGIPLGICEYFRDSERLDVSFSLRGQWYYFIHKNSWVILQLSTVETTKEGSQLALDARLDKFKTLMKMVVNSVVLHTKQ